MKKLEQFNLVFVGSPYSRYPFGIQRAFEDVAIIAGKLLLSGIRAFSPVAASHVVAMAGGLDPLDHNIWLPLMAPIRKASDAFLIVNMEGWQDSRGLRIEYEEFKDAEIPIFFIDHKTLISGEHHHSEGWDDLPKCLSMPHELK